MITFKETGLAPEILEAITEMGFISPTPIQEKTIPALLETKNDLVALAQTGTGKTAAFGLPVLQLIDTKTKDIQSLVLCPTRELALQIVKDVENFSKYKKGFRVVAVYGGASITGQIRELRDGAHMVVGTPGRVLDLIRRKVLKLGSIKWLVLDEADEMLNMGFKDDLDTILAETPQQRQTLLFSATMPKEIERIANNYMHEPERISIGKRNESAENVKHIYYMVHAKDKYEVLKRIADINPNIYGIVFCRTRMETKEVADKLMQDGYNADALHGDLSQAQRDYVMARFRSAHLQILVATDVAARGLDVNDLTHVINFNLPDDLEVYVHRSGRTGRAGKSGVSISIIHMRESGKIRDLERMTSKKFERKMVPGGKEICEKQLFNLISKVENVEVNNEQIDQYLPDIYKKLEWLSREELIKQFVSVEFNRFLTYYEKAADLNVYEKEQHQRKDRGENNRRDRDGERRSRENIKFSRFHITVGQKDNINPGSLIALINKTVKVRNIEIGKIDIMRKFSFFDADSRFEKNILSSFNGAVLDGEPIQVNISKPDTHANKEKYFEKGKRNEAGRGERKGKRRK
ncbi:MAG: DEAD/DEAH box helicase [Bacteroidales bacterium]|nr:DEAD/DEAH box helicase [Bacteroidales bacterium]